MRTFSFSLGLVLVAVIFYCGYYTNNHSEFVIWFGVVTALVSPLAFELLLFPFRSKDQELLKDLSKVPRIEALLKVAKDSEEKIALLEKQKEGLDILIAYESKRRALEAEKQIYLFQGKEALEGINRVNQGLELLTSEKHSLPPELEPLLNSQSESRETIRYTINRIPYVLRRSSFGTFPLYGPMLFDILKAFENLVREFESKNLQDPDKP